MSLNDASMVRFHVAAVALLIAASSNAHAADSVTLAGDASLVKNEDAALLLGYAGARTAEGFARYSPRSPIVWARYNPGQAVGQISIARSISLADGSTQVRTSVFAPRDGERFATGGNGRRVTYFGGVNPFAQFDAGDDFFRGANFTAFLASVGLVMRSSQASLAFVYYPVVTSTEAVRATGGEMAWSASASAAYRIQGRWLIGVPAESGDRRGLVPFFQVSGCNAGTDTRNGCRAGGFASFVAWDFGNLPNGSSPYVDRAGDGLSDVSVMRAAFAGLEGYLRDASLWADNTWNTVAGLTSTDGILWNQAAGLASGDLTRRDRLSSASANAGVIGDGKLSPSAASLWNPSDQATSDFIARPLGEVSGGLGAVSNAATWIATRDRALTQDLLAHHAGLPVIRSVASTAP